MVAPPFRLRLALVALALALPGASAGTTAEPEVTDPAGDVAALSAPMPAGFGWADLRAAWLSQEGGTVTLTIEVAGGAPPQGEVGVTFQAAGRHHIAGYTVVPGLYAGGFLSRSDADGDVPDNETPKSMPGTWSGTTIRVSFPADALGFPEGTPAAIAGPWAWSESQASNGETYRLDRTGTGRDFPAPPPARESATTTPQDSPQREAPWPFLLPALALLGVASRRR